MNKKILILGLFSLTLSLPAISQTMPNDQYTLGQGSSVADKGFIFNTGDGASNKKLLIEDSSKKLKYDGNSFQLGDGALTDKEIILNGTSGKSIKYNGANTEFELNDDVAIDAGKVLKTNSINTKSGTVTSIEQDLRAKGKIFVGASGSVQLRENSGKLEFSNDGSVYKKVGSGGGGAGAVTILENGGFEDGITSLWSASVGTATALTGAANALIGETSVSFDPAALNDYLRTSYITVPKGLRGTACEARFLYDGGDALNYSAKVETESGVVLGTFNSGAGTNVLPIHSFAGYESVFFKCPTQADITTLSTNGNIRLVIYQGTAVSATAMKVDDVHLGGLIGLVESTTPDVYSAFITAGTTIFSSTGDAITSCVVSGNNSICTLKSGYYAVAPTIHLTAVAADPRYILTYDTFSNTTFTVKASLAGVVTPTSAINFSVTLTKQNADAKQSVQVYKSIPKVSANINTIPFILTTGAGGTNPAVVTDTLGIVSSFTKTGTGTYNLGYTGLALAFVPSLVCTTTEGYLEPDSVGTSLAGLITRNASGTGADLPSLWIFCVLSKNGTDLKMPTVQPIVIGQVTSSAAETGLYNVRTESCSINNSGSPTADTASGLCASWVSSVTLGTAGLVTINFIAGTFIAEPVCTTSIINLSQASVARTSSQTASQVTIQTATHSDVAANYSFKVTCTGKR